MLYITKSYFLKNRLPSWHRSKKGSRVSSTHMKNAISIPRANTLCQVRNRFFLFVPHGQLVENVRIGPCTFSENAHAPLIFSFLIVHEVLHRLTAPWKATCGEQETARFFLLKIAPFETPKARLKNTPCPRIVVTDGEREKGVRRSRRFSMTARRVTMADLCRPRRKINPPLFRRFCGVFSPLWRSL